ncbi:putative Structural maintenance of chromosomes protein 4 [Blattamonas nauphoetae]|uniref:Structural maintenance of chromosomes protein 4 n=1 Tax=Blattamonas nauphoetae TaxID=2049346 RepID=A0ABQ9WVT2_9EUKA|nr:putative Structural maintenance of chromosomes protein 4 [Blattamonas nauphoetae]
MLRLLNLYTVSSSSSDLAQQCETYKIPLFPARIHKTQVPILVNHLITDSQAFCAISIQAMSSILKTFYLSQLQIEKSRFDILCKTNNTKDIDGPLMDICPYHTIKRHNMHSHLKRAILNGLVSLVDILPARPSLLVSAAVPADHILSDKRSQQNSSKPNTTQPLFLSVYLAPLRILSRRTDPADAVVVLLPADSVDPEAFVIPFPHVPLQVNGGYIPLSTALPESYRTDQQFLSIHSITSPLTAYVWAHTSTHPDSTWLCEAFFASFTGKMLAVHRMSQYSLKSLEDETHVEEDDVEFKQLPPVSFAKLSTSTLRHEFQAALENEKAKSTDRDSQKNEDSSMFSSPISAEQTPRNADSERTQYIPLTIQTTKPILQSDQPLVFQTPEIVKRPLVEQSSIHSEPHSYNSSSLSYRSPVSPGINPISSQIPFSAKSINSPTRPSQNLANIRPLHPIPPLGAPAPRMVGQFNSPVITPLPDPSHPPLPRKFSTTPTAQRRTVPTFFDSFPVRSDSLPVPKEPIFLDSLPIDETPPEIEPNNDPLSVLRTHIKPFTFNHSFSSPTTRRIDSPSTKTQRFPSVPPLQIDYHGDNLSNLSPISQNSYLAPHQELYYPHTPSSYPNSFNSNHFLSETSSPKFPYPIHKVHSMHHLNVHARAFKPMLPDEEIDGEEEEESGKQDSRLPPGLSFAPFSTADSDSHKHHPLALDTSVLTDEFLSDSECDDELTNEDTASFGSSISDLDFFRQNEPSLSSHFPTHSPEIPSIHSSNRIDVNSMSKSGRENALDSLELSLHSSFHDSDLNTPPSELTPDPAKQVPMRDLRMSLDTNLSRFVTQSKEALGHLQQQQVRKQHRQKGDFVEHGTPDSQPLIQFPHLQKAPHTPKQAPLLTHPAGMQTSELTHNLTTSRPPPHQPPLIQFKNLEFDTPTLRPIQPSPTLTPHSAPLNLTPHSTPVTLTPSSVSSASSPSIGGLPPHVRLNFPVQYVPHFSAPLARPAQTEEHSPSFTPATSDQPDLRNYTNSAKTLEMHNFKSYRNRTIMDFNSSFTTVIGPNGSGKSNMIDAVLFCLGNRSSNVRSENLSSLLNSAAKANGDREGSVTMTFKVNDSQNVEDFINKIVIKRVFNDTKSSFFIRPTSNSTPAITSKSTRKGGFKKVSRDELHEYLLSYGVEIDFSDRYCLLQNETATFGSKSAQEMLNYLEQFLGHRDIIRQISDKKQLLVGFQQNQYEIQRDIEAKQEIIDENNVYVDEYDEVKRKEVKSLQIIQAIEEQKKEAIIECMETEKKFIEIKTEELKALHETQTNETSQITTLEHTLSEINTKLETISLSLRNAQNNTESLYGKLSELGESVRRAERALRTLKEEKAEKMKEDADAQAKLHKAEEELQLLMERKEELTRELAEWKENETFGASFDEDRFLMLEDSHKTMKDEVTRLEGLVGMDVETEEELEAKLEAIKGAMMEVEETGHATNRSFEEQRSQLEQKISSHQLHLNTLRQSAQTKAESREKLQMELSSAKTDLQEFTQRSKRDLEDDQRMLQFFRDRRAGKISSTGSIVFRPGEPLWLRVVHEQANIHEGVVGILADVLTVNEKQFEKAVNVAFESRRKNVVVQSREDGARLISLFRERKIGVVKCDVIPHTQPHNATPSGQPKQFNRNEGTPLRSLIQSKPELDHFVTHICKNWVVCSSTDEALRLRKHWQQTSGGRNKKNIVTLSGEIFRSDGEISFRIGDAGRKMEGMKDPCWIRAASEDDQESSKIALEEQEREHEDSMRVREKEREEKLSLLQRAIETFQTRERILTSEVEESQREIREAAREMSVLQSKMGELQKQQQEFAASTSDKLLLLQQRQAECEYKLLTVDERSEEKKEEIEERLVMFREEVEKLSEQHRQMCEQRAMSSELRDTWQDRMAELKTTTRKIGALERRIGRMTQNESGWKEELEREEARLTEEMNELKEKVEETKELIDESADAIRQLKSQREDIDQTKDATEHQISELTVSTIHLSRQIEAVREHINISNVTIKRLEKEAARNETLLGVVGADLKRSLEEIDLFDEEMSGVETGTVEWRSGWDSVRFWPWLKDQDEAIETLRKEMVERRSGIRFDLIKIVFETRDDIDVLKKREESLNSIITSTQTELAQIEDIRFQSLRRAVLRLNSEVSRIYRLLTRSEGDCTITMSESPTLAFRLGLTFHVRPPSVRGVWVDYGQLSGGQQSLASLTLILSFQVCWTNCFLLMDEIECALDAVFAGRVATALRNGTVFESTALEKNQTPPQLIIVTLRRGMYFLSPQIVGVYQKNGSSCVMNVAFVEEVDEGEGEAKKHTTMKQVVKRPRLLVDD